MSVDARFILHAPDCVEHARRAPPRSRGRTPSARSSLRNSAYGLLSGVTVSVGAGGEGAGLEAPQHLLLDAAELVQGLGADVPAALGAVGDRVRCLPAVRHDAVHPRAVRQLLPEQADGDLRDHERVVRVDAVVGVGARVGANGRRTGCASARPRTAAPRPTSTGPGMGHHREVEAREGAAVEQLDLAAAALLGGGAVDLDREVELVGERPRAAADPDGDGRDEVVAAGVPEPRERVVLGADPDRVSPRCRTSPRNAVSSPR